MKGTRPLLCISGTTGSGKNSVAVAVARDTGAEIVSLDSMKVYRGLDVGTAKPTADERAAVRHHLVDILEPEERMDLRRFIDEAEKVIADLHARGVPVIIVGGTAMYLTGLLWGVHDGPSRDEAFREALRRDRDAQGVAAIHARLESVDPVSAERIHETDFQRIERALEVHHQTGRPASELRKNWFGSPRHDARVWIVTWPRDVLRARIEARVDAMFANGWVEEVRGLLDRRGMSVEASMALGYREIATFLEEGGDLDELAARVKTKTWQFARRQLTWFKKFEDATLHVCTQEDTVATVAGRIVEEIRPLWR